jgi:hypothetical protein
MRATPNEIEYKEFLLKLGSGKLPTFDRFKETIQLPDRCVVNQDQSLIELKFSVRILTQTINLFTNELFYVLETMPG